MGFDSNDETDFTTTHEVELIYELIGDHTNIFRTITVLITWYNTRNEGRHNFHQRRRY